MANELDKLQDNLNYQFSDLGLLELALTHRSAEKNHNERLEFLGDSLLGFIVSDSLYQQHPSATEGELSRMRSSIVNNASLAAIAREMRLGDHLRLGSGESKSGGNERDSILADSVEALIASVYLDAGISAFIKFVNNWFAAALQTGNDLEQKLQQQKDSKTRLQELMQSKSLPLPHYEVTEVNGAAHEQIFKVSCQITSLNTLQQGSGSSKREAEQEAAMHTLKELGETP
ncbi:MAG: ribonuclease III [Gammaproteobacteria bacterium]|nr:ribonuclease III [Gammaproteobacteria bacterium]